MSLRNKAALLAAALVITATLGACKTAPKTNNVTPTAGTAAPAQNQPTVDPNATPTAVTSDVNIALAAITWPTGAVVARVNGTDVKTDAWKQEVTRQLKLVSAEYQVNWNDKANIDRLPTVLDGVTDNMVDLELLRQLADKEGVKIAADDVTKSADTTKQQILDSGQYKDFDAFLQANSLTVDGYNALIKQQIMLDRLLATHGGPNEVEQIHARHILVADEATAKDIESKLAAGQKFEDLAKTYSTDTGSKDNGGDLGWFPRGIMLTEFDDAAFALEVGKVSQPVKSAYGYHIIRVEEKGVRALEEPMASQVHQDAFMEWLNGQRSAAKIERLFVAAPTPAATQAAPTATTPAATPTPKP
jgi:foldase protein PrsA